MTNHITRIGIDCTDDLIYAARVENGMKQPEIKALVRLPKAQKIKHHLLKGGKLFLAVPDNKVIVKRIRLAGSDPKEHALQVRFELIQSVLEDESEFLFGSIPTAQNDLVLGTIVRRDILTADDIFDPATLTNNSDAPEYLMRAIALGRGYLGFCKEEAGELVCITDLSSRNASLCFVHKRRIVGTAWINTERINLENEKDVEKLAVELKTVLNYQLLSLAGDGINAPLAAMLLSGTKSTDELIGNLKQLSSMDLRSPEIHNGFLDDSFQAEKIPIASYLIPLGLAVN